MISSNEVKGGKKNYWETNIDNQVGDPKRVGLSHVDHMMDHTSTYTNQKSITIDYVLGEEYCELVISEKEDQPSDRRRLIKGKDHEASNFQIQSPKPKHKPNQKMRKVMRRKGINIIQHSADGSDGNGNIHGEHF